MEETLLPKENKRVTLTNSKSSSGFVQELKNVSLMAAPMVVVSVSQFLLQVVSLMMAGHLGELSLAGVALATSFADVTGFSILVCSLLSLLIFTYNLQTIQMHFPSLLANQLLAIFLVQDINRFTITNLCKKNIFFNYVFFMIQINRLRKENKLHFL